MAKISFITFSRNSEEEIASLLRHVTGVVDEIIVVDGFSSDGTVEIAKNKGAKVFGRRPLGFPDPDRTFALEQASYDWILYLDTDEKLGNKLKANLRDLVEYADANGIDAYSTLRLELTKRGAPLFGPFYNYQIRIFKKSKVLFRGIVHERPQVFGRIHRLSKDFYLSHVPDYSMKKYALYAYWEKMSTHRRHGDLFLGEGLVERVLWALAPISTLGIYLYCVVVTTRKKLLNPETLFQTLRFAVYRSIAYTMMKTRTRTEEMVARAIFQRGVRKVA